MTDVKDGFHEAATRKIDIDIKSEAKNGKCSSGADSAGIYQ